MKLLRSWFGKDMAIDLGTANTIIYVKGKGIVLNEPSVVAVEHIGGQQRIREVGQNAKQMLGRTPGNITAVRPMRDGVIADYRITEQMLNHFIKKVHGARWLTPGPRMVICVPYSSTPVDRRAIKESAMTAGATKVYLVEEPMAAALGSKLPVEEPTGSMVVDVGGGTSEIGIISLGGIVYGESLKVGGDHFDVAIINYIRSNFGIAIGESTAERIKKQIAVAHESVLEHDNQEIKVSGHYVADGVPRSFQLTSRDIYQAIRPVLDKLITGVRTSLEQCPPELSSDIAESGMTLTGGGAMIKGLELMLSDATGIPVIVADEPLACVARGCGIAIDNIDTQLGNSFLD